MSELSRKLQSGRLVSVDIEPGGATKNGVVGLSEVVDGEMGNSLYMKFTSPVGKKVEMSLEEAAANMAALEAYYGGTENVPKTTDLPPDFETVWHFADAFIGDDVVTAYSHGSDMGYLKRLTGASDMELPDYYFIDGKTALSRHLGRSAGCLQTVAIEHLFDQQEIDRRREIAYSGAENCNKWLLHHAADDAEMNARVFADIIFPERKITLPQVLSSLAIKAYSLRDGKKIAK